MKFIIDAQLPRRLVFELQNFGQDAAHVIEFPDGNRTPDSYINQFTIANQAVLITKDTDFVNSFLISARPYKLLLISVGNISNTELFALFDSNLEKIINDFEKFDFIEMSKESLIFHV